MYLFNLSLRYADPIDVSIIMTLPPVFVVLYHIIFQRARPALLEYIGIAASFAGAVLVILCGHDNAGSHNLLGELLALASTICYAFYLVVMEEPSKKYRPLSTLRWVFLFAALPALLLLPQLIHSHLIQGHAGTLPWVWIGFILLCPTFLSYFLIAPADRPDRQRARVDLPVSGAGIRHRLGRTDGARPPQNHTDSRHDHNHRRHGAHKCRQAAPYACQIIAPAPRRVANFRYLCENL